MWRTSFAIPQLAHASAETLEVGFGGEGGGGWEFSA